MADFENKFKVRLIPVAAMTGGASADVIRAAQVSFDVTPQFTESRSAEYAPITPVHMPGSIQIYKHTNSRNFEISAMLISRNMQDARRNIANLQKLRAWLLPYFGATTTLSKEQKNARQNPDRSVAQSDEENAANAADLIQSQGVELLGAPPDVLYLYAYSTDANDSRNDNERTRVNINRVPVVMTNLTISYPDDVDYIPVFDSEGDVTEYSEPFPKKLQVNVSLVETHSPREYENFDLAAFKLGNLIRF